MRFLLIILSCLILGWCNNTPSSQNTAQEEGDAYLRGILEDQYSTTITQAEIDKTYEKCSDLVDKISREDPGNAITHVVSDYFYSEKHKSCLIVYSNIEPSYGSLVDTSTGKELCHSDTEISEQTLEEVTENRKSYEKCINENR